MLTAERNNFLGAVYPLSGTFGLAFADLTTGEFMTTELEDEAALLTELERLRPAEIICPGESGALLDLLRGGARQNTSFNPNSSSRAVASAATSMGWVLSGYEDWVFAPETAVYTVRDHFKVAALDGFGLKDRLAAVGAAGAILHYLGQHLRRDISSLTRLSFYQRGDFLALDATTLRHLEILEPLRHDAPRESSLYGALNRTVTPMGARRLRDWLSQPLASIEPIRRRQDAVAAFIENSNQLEKFRSQLALVRDLERTIGRLSSGAGNARDLIVLRTALEQLPALRKILFAVQDSANAALRTPGKSELPLEQNTEPPLPSLVAELADRIVEMPAVIELIGRAIVDEPPLALKEGGMIRDGFDPALDELHAATRGGKDWIAKLQTDEIARTGIASLKVRFNSVFGYYIEVTRSNLDKVPSHYTRKQTIANGERFITPELKEMEGKILGAQERSVKLEYELFQRVRETVLGQLPAMQQTAVALAQLDVLGSFAETARLHSYCRPEIGCDGVLHIRDGRHPVLEQNLSEERFVPNDTELAAIGREPRAESREQETLTPSVSHTHSKTLTPSLSHRMGEGARRAGEGSGVSAHLSPLPSDLSPPQLALITGPNMAGKSTYIRQVALLALLAHTGSFVPAAQARIDLIDRIFTRIGASDDLARGQSTFMVEMCETANILNNATAASLVVLDEIGRGTSTFDGLSLAWSILEHLHNQVGAKTLFATHYHELTELAGRLPRLRNYNVAVREWHDQIVFLRKIVQGGTDKSYGIQVARLAGIPRPILDRAKEILHNLEESELTPEGSVRQSSRRQQDRDQLKKLGPAPQMDLFSR
jgi:DNA mismatch repair protein MutS